ncbi:HNH endonuclease signature motif containing protein [Phytoactinopolyspora endophytica]|uniref:HNH endonuclease signature motif containing protein n=1 Tax=Phytoactinopolyspora endophytica TaxID=1642495 RepID=UPI00197B6744|nr:HNH endonuclease signature motif containing protein [Phytoactinopolyspora endophytica]
MKYTREMLIEAVKSSKSVAGVLRHLGMRQSGGSHAHISRRIKQLGIDTTHFTGQAHNKGRPPRNRLTWHEILVVRPLGSRRAEAHRLRRALIESGRQYRCEACGLGNSWNGNRLTLHVDHISGDCDDCRAENLRFLCPNCHTQTPTWAGAKKNRKNETFLQPSRHKGHHVWTDGDLVTFCPQSLVVFDLPVRRLTSSYTKARNCPERIEIAEHRIDA